MKYNDLYKYTKDLNILYVEDELYLRKEIESILLCLFKNVICAKDGEDGFSKYKEYNKKEKSYFDIVLTDINMPILDGIELIKKIETINKQQNIIVISAYYESDRLVNLIHLGITDFIQKPFSRKQFIDVFTKTSKLIYFEKEKIQSTIDKKLDHILKQKEQLSEINTDLEEQMIQRISEVYSLNQEVKATLREVIFTMGTICESRSKETGNHVKRVALYSKILAKGYGMKKEEITLLREASPMHDIGKIAIPDAILNKEGKLTDEERVIMNTHSSLGYEMLKHSERKLLKVSATIAYEHHEKYDGTGYPRGIKGEEISIYARITTLADVFDALGSERCYKKSWDDKRIFEMIKNESGKQFDPKLVSIFFNNIEEFLAVRESHKDIIFLN